MPFTIVWNEKTPFYAIQTTNLKSRKIEIYDSLERKHAFLGY